MSTPISQLLEKDDDLRADPTAQFARPPGIPGRDLAPATNAQPSGPSQGVSAPNTNSLVPTKEFFGLKETCDWKQALLIFAVILIISSSFAHNIYRHVPGFLSSEGKISITGSLMVAVVGTVLYMAIKVFAKL